MSLEEQFREHELQDLDRHVLIMRELGGISVSLTNIERRINHTVDDVDEITGSRIVAAGDHAKLWRKITLWILSSIALVIVSAVVSHMAWR